MQGSRHFPGVRAHAVCKLNTEQISFFLNIASIYFVKDLLTRHPATSEISSRQRGQGQGKPGALFSHSDLPTASSYTHPGTHIRAHVRHCDKETFKHRNSSPRPRVRECVCEHACHTPACTCTWRAFVATLTMEQRQSATGGEEKAGK